LRNIAKSNNDYAQPVHEPDVSTGGKKNVPPVSIPSLRREINIYDQEQESGGSLDAGYTPVVIMRKC
jgi:hypothetical protein